MTQYAAVLGIHSWLRWVTLLLAIGATLNALRGDTDISLRPPGRHWEYNDVRVNRLALALLRRFGQDLPSLGREGGEDAVARRPLAFKSARTAGAFEWCGRRDLNPHAVKRSDLNRVRLPIPPRPHIIVYSGRI